MPDDAEIQRLLDLLLRHAGAWADQHGTQAVRDMQARWWLPTDEDVGREFLEAMREIHDGDADWIHREIGRAARILVIAALLAKARDEDLPPTVGRG